MKKSKRMYDSKNYISLLAKLPNLDSYPHGYPQFVNDP